MGYDWLDDLLYPRNPGVLFLPTSLLVLENGRLFLGTDSCGSWRVREEDYRSCMFLLLVCCSDGADIVLRTKGNSILALYLSNLGMIMLVLCLYIYDILTYLFRKTSYGTKRVTTVLDHGYLRRRVETKDTRNHGRHPCTAARHIMNQEASHRRLLSLECILLLDISLVAIRLSRLSTHWRKLCRCKHLHRKLFPMLTWSALSRMFYVLLISIQLPSGRSVVSLKATLEWI